MTLVEDRDGGAAAVHEPSATSVEGGDAPGGPAPTWYWPTLLALAAVATLGYAWDLGRSPLDPYYAATVRSMSLTWHNFFYGAFDPAGTITADKLPGAFWPQALLVRAFGMHNWALVLPQVVEGALTVVVLAAAVRRLAGWRAGVLAAAVLAVSPAAVALDRGNTPDTLMTLLLVLGAAAASKAVTTPGWGPVVWAGVWVGLAFEAKMAEAWLVVPALALPVLVAGPGSVGRRVARLAVAGGVLAVVSLSWMTVVSLTPAHDRPYVDGSSSNSVFQQVFVYNATQRVGSGSATAVQQGSSAATNPARWNRLLTGSDGLATGWLLPAALVIGVGGLVATRRRPRDDLTRALLLLWATWLVIYTVAFSAGTAIITYYTGAMVPAIAALCGFGVARAWDTRGQRRTQLVLVGLVVLTVAYGIWLLPGSGTGLPHWLAVTLAAVAGAGALLAGLLLLVSGRTRAGARSGLVGAAVVVAACAALLIPTVASTTVATHDLGPFDYPFQPAFDTYATHYLTELPTLIGPVVAKLQSVRGDGYLLATGTSVLAAPFIAVTGDEIYPIGGATGQSPQPSLAELRQLVASGKIHLVLAGPSNDPRIEWIKRHCSTVPIGLSGTSLTGAAGNALQSALSAYYCTPASAAG